MAMTAMDIDIPLNSPIKRVCSQKKRNDCNGYQDGNINTEATVFTPRKPRTPAKLRLSVSVKKGPFFTLQEGGIRESLLNDQRKRAITTESSVPLNGSVLPPPDFDEATYPKGWVVGKRRRLVNVDVVESMRRIAVYEMNRKDREIAFLNEQLDEDARMMAYLQLQVQQERSRRLMKERENIMLNGRIAAIMSMFGEEELEEGQIQQEDEDNEDDNEDQPSVSSEDERRTCGLPPLDG